MAHLYQTLAWTIDQPERTRGYVIHDNDELLANVTRVPLQHSGGRPMPYADPHAGYDESRAVLCAADTDGTPYFYVDHRNNPMRPQPAFVVAANGGLIGSIAVQVSLKGTFKLLTGKSGGNYALRDAQGNEHAMLTGTGMRNRQGSGVITGADGAEIGCFTTDLSPYLGHGRRYMARVHHPLPEPARTLVFASLIGMELMIPAP